MSDVGGCDQAGSMKKQSSSQKSGPSAALTPISTPNPLPSPPKIGNNGRTGYITQLPRLRVWHGGRQGRCI